MTGCGFQWYVAGATFTALRSHDDDGWHKCTRPDGHAGDCSCRCGALLKDTL